MTDRVHPSSKPAVNGNGAPPLAPGNPAFPANKAQLYNASRPAYQPQPRRRGSRSSCCSCCLCATFSLLLLLLLAAVAGAVLWVIYRPQRPSFSVSSLQISQFNYSSSSSQLNTKFNLTLNARNPNKKITFFYDPISVSIDANGLDVGDGSFPGFAHGTKNTTTLRTTLSTTGETVQSNGLLSDLKNSNGLPLKIQMDTKVKAKVGGMKTTKVRVRVKCDGIKATAPAGKTTATTAGAKCKVGLRIKIWKWTI